MNSLPAAHLMAPLPIREIALRNRIAVSPMCQYSSEDGFATDWHLVHLGSRAVGGAGLVCMEAAAVEARGRITPHDLGISNPAPLLPCGGVGRPEAAGGWHTVAPSAVPFRAEDPAPHALSQAEIHALADSFRDAAMRALRAGFDVVEIHGAHGYLIHEFLSPLSNRRTDEYGGTLDNRLRFALEVTEAVRGAWPARLPLFFRISATDWTPGGWTADDSVALVRRLQPLGVDLVDCSSGGNAEHARIPLGPGYQVPFAERIRRETGILTGAVGLITTPRQADEIVRNGQADIVLMAREFLRDPYFPLHAASTLGEKPAPPVQYGRAF